jgi:hypothetical protein
MKQKKINFEIIDLLISEFELMIIGCGLIVGQ